MEGALRQFNGRVAVVTGAASGIGRALAERFAAEGMRIVLADVEEPALDVAVHELRERGHDVIGVVTDRPPAGRGEGSQDLRLWEQPREDFNWLFGVNLWGVVHGIRTFVPVLLEQEEGHLVNTASEFGLLTGEHYGIYTSTKHAVVALSETLARQLAGASVGGSHRNPCYRNPGACIRLLLPK